MGGRIILINIKNSVYLHERILYKKQKNIKYYISNNY
jgi:hypothetical protein